MISKIEASENAKINLNRLMEKRGLGVRELARLSENTAMTISRIKTVGKLPSVDCLLRLVQALEISIDDLFKKPRKSTNRKKL